MGTWSSTCPKSCRSCASSCRRPLVRSVDRWRVRASLRGHRRHATRARARTRVPQAGWWGAPTANTLDRATAMLPGLLYDRMDELGFDLTVLYPTAGFGIAGVARRRPAPRLVRGLERVLGVGGQAISRSHPRRRRDPDAHTRRSGGRARSLPRTRHRRRRSASWRDAPDRRSRSPRRSRSRGRDRRTGSTPTGSTARTTTTRCGSVAASCACRSRSTAAWPSTTGTCSRRPTSCGTTSVCMRR